MGGMGDKATGMGKEALGKVTGQDDMEREGEAQQKAAQKDEEAQRLEDEAAQKRRQESGHKAEETRHRES